MELDSATMAVSLIGFELGSGHREQYCTVEELYYEAEIRNVARQQALIFMYLSIEERYRTSAPWSLLCYRQFLYNDQAAFRHDYITTKERFDRWRDGSCSTYILRELI
jgi:hypothetical protein